MIGSQTPRIRIEPKRVASDGEGAAMLMQAYGVKLDEWQKLCVSAWLGKDQNGVYNVTSAGISVPRQNGKSETLICRAFYGMIVNGEKVLFSSHQMRSVRSVYLRLVSMFEDKKHPEILKEVKQIRKGNGEESIELRNGGKIQFLSRSGQAARGFDGISLLILDEAASLTDEEMASLMSILAASSTGTRQIIYAGTPPYVGSSGDVFRQFRQSCLEAAGRGEDLRVCWHEWSIPETSPQQVDVMSKALWYMCNPGLGVRLTEEFTQTEASTLSDVAFVTERLGAWLQPSETRTDLAIAPALWDSCASDEPKPEGKTAFGVKFTADGSEVVLAGAVIPSSGPARISLIAREPTGRGLSWLAEWLNERYSQTACVVIDGRNGADVLIDKIQATWKWKGSVIKPTAANVTTAASLLLNELQEKTVTWYRQQEDLRESAITATRRAISGGWGFGGQTSAPIEACSLALWGCRTSKRNPGRKMRIG